MKKSISICGSDGDDDRLSSYALEVAEKIGRLIAQKGGVLICGGRGGIMKAACKGAKRHNGVTIGILPYDYKDNAKKYVDYAIHTGMGYMRNFLVAKTGDAVIAIDGSAGTLSEMAIAWFSDKPIVALASSGGWAEKLASTKIDNRRTDEVFSADTPKEALDIIFRELRWE